MPSGSFSASAVILATVSESVSTFSDDFNRTVGPGTGSLGGPWVWSDDDNHAPDAATDNTYVNGSSVVLPFLNSTGGDNNYSSWRWGDRPPAGSVQFDFWVPPLTGQGNFRPTYGVNLDSETNPVYIYVWPDTPGSWFVGLNAWEGSGNVTDALFATDESSWYTAELIFDADQNVELRAWKVGDARPSSPMASGQMNDVDAPDNQGFPFVDLYENAISGEDAKFTNFSISGVLPNAITVDAISVQPHFTADAFFVSKHFLSDAIVKRTQGGGATTAPVFPSQLPSTGSGSQFILFNPITGTVAGDTVVIGIGYVGLGDTSRQWSTSAPGWTRVVRAMAPDGSYGLEWWAHTYTVGDSGSYLFGATTNNGTFASSGIFRVTGAPDPSRFVGGSTVSSVLGTSHSTDYVVSLDGLLFLGVAGTNTLWTTPSGMTHRTLANSDPDSSFDTSTITVTGDLGVKTAFSAINQPTVMAWFVMPPVTSLTMKAGATVGGRTFTADAIIKATISNSTAPVFGATSSTGASTTGSVSASVPAGTVRGDTLVAWVVYDAQGITQQEYISNDGWLRVAHAMLSNGDEGMDVFVHAVTSATESGTRTLTARYSISAHSIMGLSRITGADAGRYVVGQTLNTTYSNSHSTAYITSNVDGLLVLAAGGASGTTWTPAAGMTERIDTGSTLAFASLEVADQAVTTGDIGVKTVTSVNTNPDLLVWLVFPPISATYVRLDAVITAHQGSFKADAVISAQTTRTGSFTAAAVIRIPRSHTFSADATVRGAQPSSFTIDYATWSGVGPRPPLIGVPTKILVNGVDVTSHIKWKTATFSAKVNSANGDCSFDVVDRAHDLSFVFGDEIALYIDGILRWGGWVTLATRTFPFPVMKSPTTEARIWHIVGVDYNRILDTRILHDSSHPNRTWDYPAGTYDDIILNDIWSYFDMAGFTKDFHRVGQGVLDIKGVTSKTGGNVAQGGFSLRDVLLHLSWDTGAIFYVTPQKVVTYVDADLISNPYTLTDTPSGAFDVGFHDVRILEDSTGMVNDAIVWGAGKGSKNVVRSRYQSTASQDVHGLWQAGNFTEGIYKQATADAVARSQVEGSPASHRGAKNPRRAVSLLTWEPVFGVGDVVNFHDSQFLLPPPSPDSTPSHDDVLPIRTMTTTWPTPYFPLFDIQLSWEVDAVWSFFDPWLPIGAPGLGGTGVIPGGSGDSPRGCPDDVCFVETLFDSFHDRVVASGLGHPSSDSSRTWTTDFATGLTSYGVGFTGVPNQGYVDNNGASSEGQASFRMSPAAGDPWTTGGDFQFRITVNLGAALTPARFFIELDGDVCGIRWDVTVNMSTGIGTVSVDDFGNLWNASVDKTDFVIAQPYVLEGFAKQTLGAGVRLYPEGTTPGAWTQFFYDDGSSVGMDGSCDLVLSPFVVPDSLMLWNGLSFITDRCQAVQYENFDNRTLPSTWGTASGGAAWTTVVAGGSTASVSDGIGFLSRLGSASNSHAEVSATTPVDTADGFDMILAFRVNQAIAGALDSEGTEFRLADGVGGHSFLRLRFGALTGSDVRIDTNSSNYVFAPLPAFVDDEPYWMRVRYTSTMAAMRYWSPLEAEPGDWYVQTVHVGDTTSTLPLTLVIDNGLDIGTTDLIWSFGSIDFLYTGRPCYGTGCETDVIDDFGRTLAPENPPTSTWGTASGGGTWGSLSVSHGAAITQQITGGALDIAMLGSTPSPVGNPPFVTGIEQTLAATTSNHLRMKFMVDDASGSSFVWASHTYYPTRYVAFKVGDTFCQYTIWTGPSAPNSFVSIDGSDSPSVTITANTWYWLEGWSDPSTNVNRARVYADGTTPSTWDIQVLGTTASLTSSPWVQIWHGFMEPGDTWNVHVTDLETASDCSDGTWQPGTGGVPSGTHLIETLTPQDAATGGPPPIFPSGSTWTTTNAILAVSAVLIVGGAYQYGNWVITDADAGTIRIDMDVDSTLSVVLDYITNGALH